MQVIRGAGYIRVSTTEQATRGLSLEAQEAEIRRYAKERGIVLVQIYVDRGITARKKLHRREAFAQMMRDVDAGLIDRIIAVSYTHLFSSSAFRLIKSSILLPPTYQSGFRRFPVLYRASTTRSILGLT